MRQARLQPIISLLVSALLLLTSCDAPKTHKEQKAEAAQGIRMAHFRLELWEEISLQSLESKGADVGMKVLKTYSTPLIVFDFWVGGGEDVKELATLSDGRVVFLRFAQLVLYAKSATADSWGFDANFEMETAGSSVGAIAGWPFTRRSPLKLDVGQNDEQRLSGYTDTSKEPSAVYTPMARLTLVEIMPYGNKTKRTPQTLLKIPPDLAKQIEMDRDALGK